MGSESVTLDPVEDLVRIMSFRPVQRSVNFFFVRCDLLRIEIQQIMCGSIFRHALSCTDSSLGSVSDAVASVPSEVCASLVRDLARCPESFDVGLEVMVCVERLRLESLVDRDLRCLGMLHRVFRCFALNESFPLHLIREETSVALVHAFPAD